MMNFAELKEKKRIKKANQNKVKGLLDSESWRIVEIEIKNNLKEEYASLLNISPDKLKDAQRKFNIGKALIDSIYGLAGLKWEWDGYKDLREEVPDDINERKEQELLEAHLASIKEDV